MTVTSVAGLGAVGTLLGIPLGIAAHRLVVDHVGVIDFPEHMKDFWHAPQLAVMLLAGVTIAVLGALVPARTAARTTIATVLHTEYLPRRGDRPPRRITPIARCGGAGEVGAGPAAALVDRGAVLMVGFACVDTDPGGRLKATLDAPGWANHTKGLPRPAEQPGKG